MRDPLEPFRLVVSAKLSCGASRLVGLQRRERSSSRPWEYARERVLIVDHGCREEGRKGGREAIILSLVGITPRAIRSSLLRHGEQGREKERERRNNRPSGPVFSVGEETAIRSFRPSVRPSVWQFHIQKNARILLADIIFHRSSPLASLPPCPLPSSCSSQHRSLFSAPPPASFIIP